MQDHPIGGPPARRGSLEAERDVQRAVLLALLTTPSDARRIGLGDRCRHTPIPDGGPGGCRAARLDRAAVPKRPEHPRGRRGDPPRRALAGATVSARDAEPATTEDHQAQQAILALLLEAHPGQLAVDEVLRELTDRPDEFGPRDAVNNALRDLAAAGLLHRHGPFVFATRAAVRFDELKL